ncbi:MAG: hypothetical protein VW518_02055, partial [Burkholderiaceae bacterium]
MVGAGRRPPADGDAAVQPIAESESQRADQRGQAQYGGSAADPFAGNVQGKPFGQHHDALKPEGAGDAAQSRHQ